MPERGGLEVWLPASDLAFFQILTLSPIAIASVPLQGFSPFKRRETREDIGLLGHKNVI